MTEESIGGVMWRRPLKLRQLLYFTVVAEELHFGRAAARLYMAQPPLSQQIRELETFLGYELFVRGPGGVTMSAAGMALLPEARRLLAEAERIRQIGREAADGRVGTLSVGFAASVLYSDAFSAVRRVLLEAPSIAVHLHELSTVEQRVRLERGQLDVGFLRDSPPEPPLEGHVVDRDALHVVLPPEHSLSARQALAPGELAGESLITFAPHVSPSLHLRIESLFGVEAIEAGKGQEVLNWHTLIGLVGLGIGVSVAPGSLRPPFQSEVSWVPLSPGVHSEIYVCWHRDSSNPVLPRFLEAVRNLAT